MDPFLNGFEYICPKCKKDKRLKAIYTTKRRICVMCGTEITPEEVKRQVNAKLFSRALSNNDYSCPEEWIKINPSSDPSAEWSRILYSSQEYIKKKEHESKEAILEAILKPLKDEYENARKIYYKKLGNTENIVGLLRIAVTYVLMPWAIISYVSSGFCCFPAFILLLILLSTLNSRRIVDYCSIRPEIEGENLNKARNEYELKRKELFDNH